MRFRQTRLILTTLVLYFFSFPPFKAGILAYVALVPLFLLLEDVSWRTAFRLSYLAGLGTLGCLLYWLNWNSGASQIQATSMYLGTVLYLACWWGLYGTVQALINARMGRFGFAAAPFLWTCIDYLQSLGELGFTWHSLATTQTYYTPVIQFIELTGMYGLTFWLVTINVLIYGILRTSVIKISRKALLVALVFVIALPAVYGIVRLVTFDDNGKTVRVAVVQPNIEPNRKWLERDFAFTELMRLSETITPGGVDLIVWPETAMPNRIPDDQGKYEAIRNLIAEKEADLLTGIPHRERAIVDGRRFMRYYNSVYYFTPDNDSIAVYHKMHLVPFGEYVPSFLSPLKAMAMDIGVPDYEPGQKATPFQINLRRGGTVVDSSMVATAICLESVFPALLRHQIEQGARMIAVVTNDAWYDGTFGPDQHAQISVLRAVENRVPVVRSANSGVSLVIDSRGIVRQRSQNGTQACLVDSIRVPEGESFYASTGDWLPLACFIGLFLFIAVRVIFKVKTSV